MTDPNRRSRRRAYYPSPQAGDEEHQFLTPNGYRLQRQQPMNLGSPQPLPEYPRHLAPVQPHDAAVGPIMRPDFDGEVDLQNILPSKQFPNPESLDQRPLTQYCQTNMIADPANSQLKAIGKLFIQTHRNVHSDPALGSAWIAGPSILATSAHNLFDVSTQTWSTALEFHPAYNHYSSSKLPTCRVTACTIPKGYFNNPETNLDIAVCHVDQNIGDIVGETIRMEPITDNEIFERETVSVVGYPSGSGFDFGKQMWQSVGQYLFGRRNRPGDDYSPVLASRFGGGSSGCPWLIRDKHNELVAIGATSGHARLRQRYGEPNLMSVTSPFFGARMFDRLSEDSVFHEFKSTG